METNLSTSTHTCTVSASSPRSLVSSGSLPSGLGSYEVACPTSQELYIFDANGTHQFTASLITGDYMYNFSYRSVGCWTSSRAKNHENIPHTLVCLMCTWSTPFTILSLVLVPYFVFSNEEDVTAVTDSNGNTLRIRRDTNRMPVRVVAPDNQVRWPDIAFLKVPSTNR